jgi:8-oxo-dGTP pyrophosphatase MutT (NUDIX family)
MLRLIPPPLHRLLYRLAYVLRAAWLRMRGGGRVYGSSVIARDARGRLLLVRHSYGSRHWQFPGGGIGRREGPEAAARREFAEELRCSLVELTFLGTIEEPYETAVNVVHVFTGIVDGEPAVDRRELVEARFFARHELPRPLGHKAAKRIEMLDRYSGPGA